MAQRQRRHSGLCLDALVVVEMNITINHFIGFIEGHRFVSVNTLGFENGEKIFCHRIVIAVPAS